MKVLLFIFLFGSFLNASDTDNTDLNFAAGLKSYESGDFETAKKSFETSLTIQPNNAHLLFNLGLSEYRLKQFGWALGHWRMALSIKPFFSEAAEALRYAEGMVQKGPPTQNSNWDEIRKLIHPLPLDLFLFFTLVVLIVTALSWRAYWFRETPRNFPIGAGVCSLFFAILFCLSLVKVIDITEVRATIISERVEVRSAPLAGQASLYELPAGAEVLLKQDRGDWVQVKYPGGLSGWIEKKDLIAYSGRLAW